tara:strand:- start:143 stop:373 length:231 start_codon:yes stop_codon:yes gene_type:complete
MLGPNIRRLTPELLKKSPYHFNVLYQYNNHLFVSMTPKTLDPWKDIPEYDLEANQHLIPAHNTTVALLSSSRSPHS